MARIQLEAAGLEFEENGNTLWVQGAQGMLLRIKCTGRIQVKSCEAPGAHADVIVPGDIDFCIPAGAWAPVESAVVERQGRRAGRVSTSVQAVGRRAGAVPAAQTLVRGVARTQGGTVRGGRRSR